MVKYNGICDYAVGVQAVRVLPRTIRPINRLRGGNGALSAPPHGSWRTAVTPPSRPADKAYRFDTPAVDRVNCMGSAYFLRKYIK